MLFVDPGPWIDAQEARPAAIFLSGCWGQEDDVAMSGPHPRTLTSPGQFLRAQPDSQVFMYALVSE